MADLLLQVEVVYALADRQVLLAFEVRPGTNVREAVAQSGIAARVPDVNLDECPIGIFGKIVSDPQARVLEAGDRIELYRPLLVDPKEVRRQRADKAKRLYKKERR